MHPIHERMPVILSGEEAETLWLDPASTKLDQVKHLVEPHEWDGFTHHWTRPLKTGDNSPDTIAPAPEQPVLR